MASRTTPVTASALRILQVYSSDTESSDSDNESSANNRESLPKNQVENDKCTCPCDPNDFGGDASLSVKRRRIEKPAENSQENQRFRNSSESVKQDSLYIPSKHGHSQVESRLPSVPEQILGMFSENENGKPQDNPDMHSGRIRSFPHVRGNWVSYVHISCTVKIKSNKIIGCTMYIDRFERKNNNGDFFKCFTRFRKLGRGSWDQWSNP